MIERSIDVGILIFEGGFPDERSLASFCLSIGVLHDRRSGKGDIPFGLEIDDLDSYELCSLVLIDQMKEDIDLRSMNRLLGEYARGGAEMVLETMKGKMGFEALNSLLKLMPP